MGVDPYAKKGRAPQLGPRATFPRSEKQLIFSGGVPTSDLLRHPVSFLFFRDGPCSGLNVR